VILLPRPRQVLTPAQAAALDALCPPRERRDPRLAMRFMYQQGQTGRRRFSVGPAGSGSSTTWSATDKTSGMNLTAGNMTWSETNSTAEAIRSTTGVSTGKWYWEVLAGTTDQGAMGIRIAGDAIGSAINAGTTCSLRSTGTLFTSGGPSSAGGTAPAGYGAANVVMHAFDADAGLLWLGLDGAWPGSIDPATGTGYTFNSIPAGTYHAYNWSDNNSTNCSATLNCGASAFYHPAIFSALQAAGFSAL
jgi:hypothetical protein